MAINYKTSPVSVSLNVSFVTYAIITVSLPLGALLFCFVTAIIFQYDIVNETVCNVTNFVPSISAITGVFPQTFVWRLCIALHSTPRLYACWMYYNYYAERILNVKAQHRATFKKWMRLNFWLNFIENMSLASVSFISNKEHYPIHEKIFVLFMVTSLCYMVLNTCLHRWSCTPVYTDTERSSHRAKLWFLAIALTSTAALLVAFYLHRVKCVPLAFSYFSIAEYIIAVTNMAYHMTAIYEFGDKQICWATPREEYSNGCVTTKMD